MSSLKDMYRTVLKDTFPDTMTITPLRRGCCA